MAFEDKFHIKFLRICGWNRFKFGTHTHTHTHTHRHLDDTVIKHSKLFQPRQQSGLFSKLSKLRLSFLRIIQNTEI